MTDKIVNINKLKPFINDRENEINSIPETFHINESDKYYIATNKHIAGIIFKENNIEKDIDYKFNNTIDFVIKVWKEYRKLNEYYITINRKDMLDGIKKQWKQLKFSAKSCGVNLHKEDVIIILTKDFESYNLNCVLKTKYNIEVINDKLYSDVFVQDIDTDYRNNFKYGFNLKYFEIVLSFFDNKEIKVKIGTRNVMPCIFEQEDREVLICPVTV